MGLFDSDSEEPKSKMLRWMVTSLSFVILLSVTLWYLLRFQPEKNTVRHFMETVAAGKMEEAYRLWKPVPAYTYQDFLSDWGPSGEYGPVKSFRITMANRPRRASNTVVVAVEVSPDQPFPTDDLQKLQRTKEVRLWVQRSDQSLSFPP